MGNDNIKLSKIYASPDAVTYIFEGKGYKVIAKDIGRDGTIDNIRVVNECGKLSEVDPSFVSFDRSKCTDDSTHPAALGALRFADEFNRMKSQVEQAVAAFLESARAGETNDAVSTQMLADGLRWPLGEERKDVGYLSVDDACKTQRIRGSILEGAINLSYTVTDDSGFKNSIDIFINPTGFCRYASQADAGFRKLINYLDQMSDAQDAMAKAGQR